VTKVNFEKLRDEMVSRQILGRRITDKRILEAFRKLPQHLFVPLIGEYGYKK